MNRRKTTDIEWNNNVTNTESRRVQPSKSLFQRSWPIAIFLVVGLILGVVAGVVASGAQKASYLATSTYALIPGGATVPGLEPIPSGGQPPIVPAESGQLALLTPVIAAVISDPATKSEVQKITGSSADAVVVSKLVPNSPLLFSVQVSAGSADRAYSLAQAYEESMPDIAKVTSSLAGTGATLAVVTGAEKSETSQGLPAPVIIGIAGFAGLVVFAAISWAWLQRRRWSVMR